MLIQVRLQLRTVDFPVMVRISILERSRLARLNSKPLLETYLTVVIKITCGEHFVDQKVSSFCARKLAIVVFVCAREVVVGCSRTVFRLLTLVASGKTDHRQKRKQGNDGQRHLKSHSAIGDSNKFVFHD